MTILNQDGQPVKTDPAVEQAKAWKRQINSLTNEQVAAYLAGLPHRHEVSKLIALLADPNVRQVIKAIANEDIPLDDDSAASAPESADGDADTKEDIQGDEQDAHAEDA